MKSTWNDIGKRMCMPTEDSFVTNESMRETAAASKWHLGSVQETIEMLD